MPDFLIRLSKFRRTTLFAITISSIFAGTAFRNLGVSWYDQHQVSVAIRSMKTVCIGRFLVDVPIGVNTRVGYTHLHGWDVNIALDESDADFDQQLKMHEFNLNAGTNERRLKNLESTTVLKGKNGYGKVFVYDRNWSGDSKSGKVPEISYVKGAGAYRLDKFSIYFSNNNMDGEDGAFLVALIDHIRPMPRNGTSIPSGYCIGPALLLEPLPMGQYERATMHFEIHGHPDISIKIRIAAEPNSTSPIEFGEDSIRREAPYATTLRRGGRQLGGVYGRELLWRNPDFFSGIDSHTFDWESTGKPAASLGPFIYFEMKTGYGTMGRAVKPSLSDAALLMLWDKFTSSLRLRPTLPVMAAESALTAPHPPE